MLNEPAHSLKDGLHCTSSGYSHPTLPFCVRGRPVLRFDRQHPPFPTGRGHSLHRFGGRLLAGCRRRRHLRLRRRQLFRINRKPPTQQPHRWDGSHSRPRPLRRMAKLRPTRPPGQDHREPGPHTARRIRPVPHLSRKPWWRPRLRPEVHSGTHRRLGQDRLDPAGLCPSLPHSSGAAGNSHPPRSSPTTTAIPPKPTTSRRAQAPTPAEYHPAPTTSSARSPGAPRPTRPTTAGGAKDRPPPEPSTAP